ncbi:hypothetical protein M413DRAFT_235828 [Hebeloma cylindrosporum]|uniref:Uncharacterized protein n=1 Tax=Hebeloma cylindrosporum TaxID=76867 RepID=A0A0C2YDL5_HEBCY|nr:hypothetical protein M413DRAFT_235828 [Hebeloma cylindrosporum h7]
MASATLETSSSSWQLQERARQVSEKSPALTYGLLKKRIQVLALSKSMGCSHRTLKKYGKIANHEVLIMADGDTSLDIRLKQTRFGEQKNSARKAIQEVITPFHDSLRLFEHVEDKTFCGVKRRKVGDRGILYIMDSWHGKEGVTTFRLTSLVGPHSYDIRFRKYVTVYELEIKTHFHLKA